MIGGETAEMPGLYSPGEYDLAGFVVGAVERTRILPNLDTINPGDIVLGLASSGVHSNGFSLVRHVVAKTGLKYTDKCPFDQENTLGKALLAPTRIYVRQLLSAINTGLIKSMAHITGGGLLENIPRALNNDRGVILDAASWPLLPVFKWIKEMGSIDDHELSRTFNCGIGMVIIVSPENVSIVQGMLQDRGEDVYQIGKVVVREAASTEEAVVVLNTGDEWN